MDNPKTVKAFQDYFPENLCFGCGPANPKGLKIKSYWSEDGESAFCIWHPLKHCVSRNAKFLHGGNLCSLIDCHSIWTAIAYQYRFHELREMGTKPDIIYVTHSLYVEFIKPISIDKPLIIIGQVEKTEGRKSFVTSTIFVEDEKYVKGTVVAVRI